MTERPLTLAIVVGEESGDQLGAGLVDALRRRRPDIVFLGTAGSRMEARGLASLFPLEDVAVMGLGAIVRHLPTIWRRVHETVDRVVAARPDGLVIIDSPGFTHSVAERVAKRLPCLPIVDYVSPSVWAWRPGRAKRMAKIMDHVLALLPFEPAAHERLGGPPCTYVGHPLVERLDEMRPGPGERRALDDRPSVLVLPGSRRTEIARLMEPFGEAVALIAAKLPSARFVLPAVPHLAGEIRAAAASWPVRPEIVEGEAGKFAAFRAGHAALAASGTVTLELGLAGVPMVVAYRVDPVARALKRFLKVPSIVLTNLVLSENAVPEYLDEAGSPQVLAAAMLALLEEGPVRARQVEAFGRLDALMALPGGQRPSERAAGIVLDIVERRGV